MTKNKEKIYSLTDTAQKDELNNLEKIIQKDFWRQKYHIMPKTGLLNDPNGLSYFNGKYHVFFQWFPFDSIHGMKHWAHYTSKDLVNWEEDKRILIPDQWYETHGAYSGSAFVKNDKLYLMYTGNVRDKNNERKSYQCLASLEDDKIEKYDKNPVVSLQPNGYTSELRDPKVFEKNNKYYFIIGAQRINKTGTALIYESENLYNWNFIGEVNTKNEDFGYMWECPDYFELNNNGILLLCPQGIVPEGNKYNNIYQSGYFIGNPLDMNSINFEHGEFLELDRGFDFYAPQTLDDGKRRILIGWMGLPEISYPTDKNHWAHCLTIPRELSISNGKLIQKPVAELELLRKTKDIFISDLKNEKINLNMSGISYELIAEFRDFDNDFGLELRCGNNEKTVISYDFHDKKIILDRSNSGENFGLEYGTQRKVSFINSKIKFHIFMDNSSLEIFVNDGEEIFTSRIFPSENSKGINIFSAGNVKVNITKWDI